MPKPSYGGAAAGALGGAATGAAVGSVVPVIGTAIGAGAGGLLGGLTGLFGTGSKKAKNKKRTVETPEQEELRRLLYQGITTGEGPFKNLSAQFNQENFQKGVSEPALKNFQENILPMIQQKFAGRGLGGSGAERAQAQAARQLQSDLASLMYQAQQQQGQNALQGANTVLGGRSFENTHTPGREGVVSNFIAGAAPGIGKATGSYLNNLMENKQTSTLQPQSPPTTVG